MSTCMKALCRHVKQNKSQGGLNGGRKGGLKEGLKGRLEEGLTGGA